MPDFTAISVNITMVSEALKYFAITQQQFSVVLLKQTLNINYCSITV